MLAQDTLRQFERSASDLWMMMTQVNTEIMVQQAASSGDDESALAQGLRTLAMTCQAEGPSQEDTKVALMLACAHANWSCGGC